MESTTNKTTLKTYLVGGAVRDFLLDIDSKDRDYVVVDATEEQMLNLGFEKVGQDFPVFLHPETKDEYALARKERKTGVGYAGFSFDIENVSLEDDLFRRDLTINAMAIDLNNNEIIDPFGGQNDLKNKILKHVSIHFAEDPVRILRIARFAARYNFSIHPDTMDLLKSMVENKEADHLVQERITKEFDKALFEPFLHNFFNTLKSVNLLEKLGNFNTLLNNQEIIENIKKEYENNNKNIQQFLLNYIFQDFSHHELKKFKLEATQIEGIELFKLWKDKLPYKNLTQIEKIQFLKNTKSIHQSHTAVDLDKFISFLNNNTHSQDSILKDIEKLKSINYEEITKNCLDKKNIKQVIEQSQLDAISEFEKKPKIKP